MNSKEILAGLKYRLTQLKKAQEVYEKGMEERWLIEENCARIDEIESVVAWIKENQHG